MWIQRGWKESDTIRMKMRSVSAVVLSGASLLISTRIVFCMVANSWQLRTSPRSNMIRYVAVSSFPVFHVLRVAITWTHRKSSLLHIHKTCPITHLVFSIFDPYLYPAQMPLQCGLWRLINAIVPPQPRTSWWVTEASLAQPQKICAFHQTIRYLTMHQIDKPSCKYLIRTLERKIDR